MHGAVAITPAVPSWKWWNTLGWALIKTSENLGRVQIRIHALHARPLLPPLALLPYSQSYCYRSPDKRGVSYKNSQEKKCSFPPKKTCDSWFSFEACHYFSVSNMLSALFSAEPHQFGIDISIFQHPFLPGFLSLQNVTMYAKVPIPTGNDFSPCKQPGRLSWMTKLTIGMKKSDRVDRQKQWLGSPPKNIEAGPQTYPCPLSCR